MVQASFRWGKDSTIFRAVKVKVLEKEMRKNRG
jgi:hypothetical protein